MKSLINCLLAVGLCSMLWAVPATGYAAVDVSIALEGCVNVETVVAKGGVCYVKGLEKKDGYWEVTIGVGINVIGKEIIVGGANWSWMLVAKAIIKGSANKEEALKELDKKLSEIVKDPKKREEIIKKVKDAMKRGPAEEITSVKKEKDRLEFVELKASGPLFKKLP